MNKLMLEWFDKEIEIAKSVGPVGYATVLTLKQDKRLLESLIKKKNN